MNHVYTASEERLNVGTHGLGLILSVIGLVMLVLKAAKYGTAIHIVSFAVFGASLVILYSASTLYHSSTTEKARARLRAFDHASIYILIAGTYTPLALLVLQGTVGWLIFSVAWGLAVVGVVVKLFFTGRFDHLSTTMYVFMGWIIIFAFKPLVANLAPQGLTWLFAGGIAYTVGALFYSIKKMPFAHATFHFFVLAGSICHFISVYWFVLTRNGV